MYLLDTNVISEGRKLESGRIDANVAAWLRSTDATASYLSAMTVFELELGVLQVDRRDTQQGATLRRWLSSVVLPRFHDRVLPMSGAVATRCARLHVPDPRSERDSWIAATALVHNLTVVTRNVTDFESSGVPLINPWTARVP